MKARSVEDLQAMLDKLRGMHSCFCGEDKGHTGWIRCVMESESMSKHWGWKATLSVYVQGGQEDIEAVLDTLESAVQGDDIHFAGILAERVDTEPKDQVAS